MEVAIRNLDDEETAVANLKGFGCHAYVHIPREKRSKQDAKAVLCRLLGYWEHDKMYRFEDLSTG